MLNKQDLVDQDRIGILRAAIHKLNPGAKILESSYSKIPCSEIINTGMFNFDEAEQSAGWIEELKKDGHTPETEEYGISSFVYRSRKPFDPERFWTYIEQEFPTTIIGVKACSGWLLVLDQAMVWGQAGGSLKADSAGVWWSSMPFENEFNMPHLSIIKNISKQDGIKPLEIVKRRLSLLVRIWTKFKFEKNWMHAYQQTRKSLLIFGERASKTVGLCSACFRWVKVYLPYSFHTYPQLL